jgi:hypothetical protein
VDTHLFAITMFVRGPEPPDMHAQPVVILPGTQFGPARQVSRVVTGPRALDPAGSRMCCRLLGLVRSA